MQQRKSLCISFLADLNVMSFPWEKSESRSVTSDSLWPYVHGQPHEQLFSSPSGSSVHGILLARILEWVSVPFSRGSFQTRDWICISCIAVWATRVLPIESWKQNYWVRVPSQFLERWTTSTCLQNGWCGRVFVTHPPYRMLSFY